MKKLIRYIILTFLITWSLWIIQIFLPEENFILKTIGTYGPLIALVIEIYIFKQKEIIQLITKQIKLKNHITWYIFATLSTAIIGIISIIINNTLFEPVNIENISPTFIAIAIPYVLITSVIGEETGFKGYALTKSLQLFGNIKGTIIMGIIWGLWHLPLFYIPTDFHTSIPFLLFLSQSILMMFIYTWIYIKTKNLILQHIFHTFSNITVGLLPLIPIYNGNNLKPLIISILLLLLLVITLIPQISRSKYIGQ